MSFCAHSQPIIQKVLPSDKSRPGWFGDPNGRHTSMAMDANTLVVGDAEWYSYLPSNIGCSAGYGAVNIYKKSGNTWALSQTFLHTPGSERKFGGNMSLRNNVLAVSAEREDNGATTRVGAIFVYKRNDANANFTQIGKVYPPDGYSSMDFGNSSVATNGQYVVSGGKNGIQKIYVFQVNNNSVAHFRTIATPGFVPLQMYVMDNNTIIAVSSGKNIKMFKLENNNYVEVVDSKLTITNPYHNYTGISTFDGNTLVAEVREQFMATYTFFRVFKLGYNVVESTSDISAVPFKVDNSGGNSYTPSIALKENKWLFIANRRTWGGTSRNQALAYRYHNGKYYYAGTVDRSDDNISSASDFASGLVTNGEILGIADKGDKSNGTVNYSTTCDKQVHPGAVSLYEVKYDYMSWGNAGAQKAVNPLADKYDYMGYDVAVYGDYALIGVGDNDYEYFNGAAMLYKKENGQWNFLRKLHHYQGFLNNARMGDAVDLTTGSAIVGAPLYINSSGVTTGAMFAYTSYNVSAEPLENVASAKIVLSPSPAAFDYFGFDVSVYGDRLITSAPYKNNSKGAVYYYLKDAAGNWVYQQTISHSSLANNDNFGYSVKLYGDYLLIGAPGAVSNDGAVYLYKLTNGSFVYQAKWTPIAGSKGYFGRDVTMGADYAAIGGLSTTSVRVYKRSGTSWALDATLSPVSANTNLNVAIDGTKLMIGVSNEGGQSKAIRYELWGTTWTKTGTMLLGAGGRPTRVAIVGDQSLIGYNSNAYKDGYGLFTNFYNISGARAQTDNAVEELEVTSESGVIVPNPVIGEQLTIGLEEATSVALTAISGGKTYSFPVVGGICHIGSLPQGVYIASVTTPTERKTQRLVIK